jgi:hypothetical protein
VRGAAAPGPLRRRRLAVPAPAAGPPACLRATGCVWAWRVVRGAWVWCVACGAWRVVRGCGCWALAQWRKQVLRAHNTVSAVCVPNTLPHQHAAATAGTQGTHARRTARAAARTCQRLRRLVQQRRLCHDHTPQRGRAAAQQRPQRRHAPLQRVGRVAHQPGLQPDQGFNSGLVPKPQRLHQRRGLGGERVGVRVQQAWCARYDVRGRRGAVAACVRGFWGVVARRWRCGGGVVWCWVCASCHRG